MTAGAGALKTGKEPPERLFFQCDGRAVSLSSGFCEILRNQSEKQKVSRIENVEEILGLFSALPVIESQCREGEDCRPFPETDKDGASDTLEQPLRSERIEKQDQEEALEPVIQMKLLCGHDEGDDSGKLQSQPQFVRVQGQPLDRFEHPEHQKAEGHLEHDVLMLWVGERANEPRSARSNTGSDTIPNRTSRIRY